MCDVAVLSSSVIAGAACSSSCAVAGLPHTSPSDRVPCSACQSLSTPADSAANDGQIIAAESVREALAPSKRRCLSVGASSQNDFRVEHAIVAPRHHREVVEQLCDHTTTLAYPRPVAEAVQALFQVAGKRRHCGASSSCGSDGSLSPDTSSASADTNEKFGGVHGEPMRALLGSPPPLLGKTQADAILASKQQMDSWHNLFGSSQQCSCQLELHHFQEIRLCRRDVLCSLFDLFERDGWPGPINAGTRSCIAELLGMRYRDGVFSGWISSSVLRHRKATHVAWVTLSDGCCGVHSCSSPVGDRQTPTSCRTAVPVAAAIMSVYKYKDRRRCGCLEYIVSRTRGAGAMILRSAAQVLVQQGITKLYSAADLSKTWALRAHEKWGFQHVSQEQWAEVGLKAYRVGEVCYMLLNLLGDM